MGRDRGSQGQFNIQGFDPELTSELTTKGFFFPKRVFILKPIVTLPDCDKTSDSDQWVPKPLKIAKRSKDNFSEQRESFEKNLEEKVRRDIFFLNNETPLRTV